MKSYNEDAYTRGAKEFAEKVKSQIMIMQAAELRGEDMCPCKETGMECKYIGSNVSCQYCTRETTLKQIDKLLKELDEQESQKKEGK